MAERRARAVLGSEGEAPLTLTTAPAWVAIINPRAGGRTGADEWAQRLRGAVDQVLVSEGPGHVDVLVRSCRDAAGILVAGGDGTLFEVLQACDRSRQRIALIPAGRGNSLAKDLGLADHDAAIDCIRNGVDRAIDLLAVSLREANGNVWTGVSASNLAIGYPARVARLAARWRRLSGGSYVAAALAAPIDAQHVRMRCDEEPESSTSVTGLVISNSRYVGPFLGFPSSSLSDGVFHTIELRARKLRQTLHNLSSLTNLRFYEPGVRKDLRSIDVRLETPTLLKIDGELRAGVQEIRVGLLRSAATFRVPAVSHG